MTNETRLTKQLLNAKEWARKARITNQDQYVNNIGLMYVQVAIEQIINYLEMKESLLKSK